MKISLSRLSTKNLATLTQRLIQSSKKGKYKIVESNPLLVKLEEVYNAYDAVYTKQSYSGKGKSVAEADKQRDDAFRALKNFLYGYAQLPIAPNYQDAAALYEVFKTYGVSLHRLSYSEETAQINKLLATLESTENQERLQHLNIVAAFAELKSKQAAFETLFAEQAEANATLRQSPSATSVRKELHEALRNYLSFVTAMKEVDAWKELYSDLNEVVKAAKNSSITVSE